MPATLQSRLQSTHDQHETCGQRRRPACMDRQARAHTHTRMLLCMHLAVKIRACGAAGRFHGLSLLLVADDFIHLGRLPHLPEPMPSTSARAPHSHANTPACLRDPKVLRAPVTLLSRLAVPRPSGQRDFSCLDGGCACLWSSEHPPLWRPRCLQTLGRRVLWLSL
jgi:hypothetical protein